MSPFRNPVTVPEFTVNKDGEPTAPKYDVRTSRDFTGVPSEVNALPTQQSKHTSLGAGVAPPNTGHAGAALRLGHNVGQIVLLEAAAVPRGSCAGILPQR